MALKKLAAPGVVPQERS